MTLGARWRRTASAQELLPLDDVIDDVVRLRSGEYRAALQAGCVNFALKSEAEQDAILAGYRRFLNGLSHPLQLLVRVVPTDVGAYLRAIDDGAATGNEMLRRIARDHEAFVRRIARERTLLDRRFYVVIPCTASAVSGPRRMPWRRQADGERARLDFLAARRQLAFRCAEVEHGLAAFGVTSWRLDGDELAVLWRTTLLGGATAAMPRPPAGSVPVVTAHRRAEAPHA